MPIGLTVCPHGLDTRPCVYLCGQYKATYQTSLPPLHTYFHANTSQYQNKHNFQNQINDLMGSIAGYEQRYLDQQKDYDQRLLDMRSTLSAQMNPQMRNPIFGVRSQAMGRGGRSMRDGFGRLIG